MSCSKIALYNTNCACIHRRMQAPCKMLGPIRDVTGYNGLCAWNWRFPFLSQSYESYSVSPQCNPKTKCLRNVFLKAVDTIGNYSK